MPEEIMGIPIHILYVLVLLFIGIAFLVSYIFFQKDSGERIISYIAGFFSTITR